MGLDLPQCSGPRRLAVKVSSRSHQRARKRTRSGPSGKLWRTERRGVRCTNWQPSCCAPVPCRLAQDARHHGRYDSRSTENWVLLGDDVICSRIQLFGSTVDAYFCPSPEAWSRTAENCGVSAVAIHPHGPDYSTDHRDSTVAARCQVVDALIAHVVLDMPVVEQRQLLMVQMTSRLSPYSALSLVRRSYLVVDLCRFSSAVVEKTFVLPQLHLEVVHILVLVQRPIHMVLETMESPQLQCDMVSCPCYVVVQLHRCRLWR